MLDGAESSPWWWTLWRHVPLEASQRNRDHPPAVHGTARCDTDKVVALMLRSYTDVLTISVEAPGLVGRKKGSHTRAPPQS